MLLEEKELYLISMFETTYLGTETQMIRAAEQGLIESLKEPKTFNFLDKMLM